MNSWISTSTPLMSLIFDFMDLFEIQRWRLTSKIATEDHDVFIHPKTWKDVCLNSNQVLIRQCTLCMDLQQLKNMFYCQACMKLNCGMHVVACNMCLFETCSDCATKCGCNQCLCHPAYY